MPFGAPEKDRKRIDPAEPRPMVDPLFFFGPSGALLGLFVVYVLYRQMGKPDSEEESTSTSQHFSLALNQQFQIGLGLLGAIFVALLMLYFAGLSPASVAPAFLIGGFCSALSSQLSAVLFRRAIPRILKARTEDAQSERRQAFQASMAIGLVPASIALLYVSAAYIVMTGLLKTLSLAESTTIMVSFALGSTVQALLARAGGEILRLSSAKLTGKTVSRVSGSIADLYDSFVSANFASIALAVSAVASFAPTDIAAQARVSLLPLALSSVGIIASLIGALLKEKPSEQVPVRPYFLRMGAACGLFCVIAAGICFVFLRGLTIPSQFGWSGLWGCVVAGTLAALVLSRFTRLPQKSWGMATWNFMQTGATLWLLALIILSSFWMAGGFTSAALGMFGLSLTAVGFFAPLSLFGANQILESFSDNTGTQARTEASPLESQSAADSLQNLGRLLSGPIQNISVGGTLLSAVALFATYHEEIKRQLVALAAREPKVLVWGKVEIDQVAARAASHADLAGWYQVTLFNPLVHFGLIIGATIPLALAGLITSAAQRSSSGHSALPDSPERPEQSARSAYRQVPLALLFLLMLPSLAGLVLGPAGTMGLLIGCTLSGCLFGLFINESEETLSGTTLNACSKLVILSALLGAGLTATLAPAAANYLGLA